MEHVQPSDGMSLSYYWGVLLRRWRAILVCVLLGLWAAIALVWVVPQQATGTAIVSVNIISTDPFNLSRSASGLLDIESETQIASSAAVADRVAEALGGEMTANDVRSAVEVLGVNETSIIRVSATADAADEARAMADTVATEYLAYRSGQAQARIDRTLQSARTRLESLRADLADANEREATAAAAEDDDALNQAETDRSLITLEITSLLSQLATTEAIDTTAGSILTPADRSQVSLSPPVGLLLVTGVLVGLGIGVLVAFMLNARGGKVRSARDVANSGGHAVVGELTGRMAHMPAQGRDLEQHRAIRETLLADPRFNGENGVCVVADLAGIGSAADVPLNLASTMAEVGLPVQLVGIGMSRQLLTHAVEGFGLRPERHIDGVTFYASQTMPGFRVVDVGASSDAGALEPISRVVREEIRTRRDKTVVVLAVPPEASAATKLAALRLSDVVLFIVGARVTSVTAIRRTAQDASRVGGQVVGSVLVGRNRSLALPESRVGGDKQRQPQAVQSRS